MMLPNPIRDLLSRASKAITSRFPGGRIPPAPVTIALATVIGILGGYGSILFTFLIETVQHWTLEPVLALCEKNLLWLAVLCAVPALGLVAVSWFTQRFAPEAQGHGVPEVITAIGRHDGVIRPRVSLVKILASGVCIGTGGSIGREGPIVQIGSSLGSMAGQIFRLSPRNIKVLVAAGAAAGISATFNAPLAGVIFASEIILGSFAVESMTPIVVASVLANVVQRHSGEHGAGPAFPELYHRYEGAWGQLPSYFLLGLVCGLAAVGFTKLLYAVEDFSGRKLPRWWMRAAVLGLLVGVAGAIYYPFTPPRQSDAAVQETDDGLPLPPLFGVGYPVVDHMLHLESKARDASEDDGKPSRQTGVEPPPSDLEAIPHASKVLSLSTSDMIAQFWWLLPLALLKPLVTSLTLGGGGSGGIFAPSLFLGATLGACFGLLCNVILPEAFCTHPGVYAIIGMGAVVAGTTHGTLSAIMIVYEMTDNYMIILPIMIAAGLAGVVARFVDPESIYTKKLSRRRESIARGHDMQRLEHIMVRDVMISSFPTVRHTDDLTEIIRVARANAHIESLPVMDDAGKLTGIIRPGDLQRILDTDISPHLVNAGDIAQTSPISLPTDANLIEALRDFGVCDIETLPVEEGTGADRHVVGILLRADVMGRYREEMLRR